MIGALLVDKPAGPTSHDVIARVRLALGVRSVGHTGTLDPFATGLLVVLIGRATRLARYFDDRPKTYRATVRLGQGSDTDDATGVLGPAVAGGGWGVEEVGAALGSFVGTYAQRPPAYSAKKIDGRRAYALARKGEDVSLPPVEVTVHSAELLGYQPPDVDIRVSVSGGTYVRALARDLGERLGVPAHCAALRREAIGDLRVDQAMALDAITRSTPLLTAAAVLAHLPCFEVSAEGVEALGHGRQVPSDRPTDRPSAALFAGRLIAVGHGTPDGHFQPDVVMEGA
ncbi:MAG: tRNA pseudouridine(55) synthase TruB [Gemmatimonadales bacterium]